MKVTRGAINRILPRIDVLKGAYQYHGQTGIVKPHTSVLSNLTIYSMDNGTTWHCLTAGYGDALPAKIYKGEYTGGNFVDIAYEWMQGRLDRAEVITQIQAALYEIGEGQHD